MSTCPIRFPRLNLNQQLPMSTSDSNNDELNNEFEDFANSDAGVPLDGETSDGSAYTEEASGDAYADAGEYADPNDYADSGEYSEADSSEYPDADSSEYPADAYAPLEGDEYSDGAYADEPVEEERQEVYFPPVMNRYNVILLISLIILCIGIVLVLIRLADYKFNVKAKQTDSGFASVERVDSTSNAAISVIKNV